MKAFLLAAGLGTRLKPLTDTIPKCLVPIRGKPLLYYWFVLFQKYSIKEVLINTHYLSDKVKEYISNYSNGLKIRITYEPVLLGSAGTIKYNRDFVAGEESFFIFYADNLVDVNLEGLKNFHNRHNGVMTVGLFESENPSSCGIATINKDGLIIEFREKPAMPQSNLASAGIFLARQGIFDFIPDKVPADIGYDLLPQVVDKSYGVLIKGYLRDIGTLESYKKAEEEWRTLHYDNKSDPFKD